MLVTDMIFHNLFEINAHVQTVDTMQALFSAFPRSLGSRLGFGIVENTVTDLRMAVGCQGCRGLASQCTACESVHAPVEGGGGRGGEGGGGGKGEGGYR